ncbi:hypothetical protein Bbelb_353440 [Branchiostoma belcheri]|nr:hypothetical protein Bbelb_353440 [Branchiostoma belcheri]
MSVGRLTTRLTGSILSDQPPNQSSQVGGTCGVLARRDHQKITGWRHTTEKHEDGWELTQRQCFQHLRAHHALDNVLAFRDGWVPSVATITSEKEFSCQNMIDSPPTANPAGLEEGNRKEKFDGYNKETSTHVARIETREDLHEFQHRGQLRSRDIARWSPINHHYYTGNRLLIQQKGAELEEQLTRVVMK